MGITLHLHGVQISTTGLIELSHKPELTHLQRTSNKQEVSDCFNVKQETVDWRSTASAVQKKGAQKRHAALLIIILLISIRQRTSSWNDYFRQANFNLTFFSKLAKFNDPLLTVGHSSFQNIKINWVKTNSLDAMQSHRMTVSGET